MQIVGGFNTDLNHMVSILLATGSFIAEYHGLRVLFIVAKSNRNHQDDLQQS
jgi:hypothetical protein